MKKKTGEWNTILCLDKDEAKNICRLGQGEKCCPFLVLSPNGFECWKMNYPDNISLHKRIKEGTINAKGKDCDVKTWDNFSAKAKEIGLTEGT